MLARAAVFLVVASAWCVDGQMGPRWIVPAQKAMQAQSEGRWSDAAAHYAVCLESGVPADKEVAVRTNLGLSLHNTGKYEEAIAAYDAVLALQPTYADCHHNKGNSLYKARRHAEAVEVSFFLTLIHFPHMPHPIFPICHTHVFKGCGSRVHVRGAHPLGRGVELGVERGREAWTPRTVRAPPGTPPPRRSRARAH